MVASLRVFWKCLGQLARIWQFWFVLLVVASPGIVALWLLRGSSVGVLWLVVVPPGISMYLGWSRARNWQAGDQARRVEFENIFGVSPPTRRWELSSLQSFVDGELARLAGYFMDLCAKEDECREVVQSIGASKAKSPESMKALRAEMTRAETNLREASLRVRRAKEEFWRAHRLARAFEFVVGRRVGDYAKK